MPQMAPMSWMTMFIYFLMTLMLVSVMNYFLYNPKMMNSEETKQNKTKTMNWKW